MNFLRPEDRHNPKFRNTLLTEYHWIITSRKLPTRIHSFMHNELTLPKLSEKLLVIYSPR